MKNTILSDMLRDLSLEIDILDFQTTKTQERHEAFVRLTHAAQSALDGDQNAVERIARSPFYPEWAQEIEARS